MAKKRLSTKKKFNKTTLQNVPNQSGVYTLQNKKGETVYVGMAGAGRLQDRLQEHLNQKDIRGAVSFQTRITSSEKEAKALEKKYIESKKPSQNEQYNS